MWIKCYFSTPVVRVLNCFYEEKEMTIDKKKRENRILEAIVRFHVQSALPVSSNQIARALGLSSATIRNVMFELEKEGYLRQPYTSAGRVPTDLGYRRYVDSIEQKVEDLRRENISLKMKQYLMRKRFFEEIIEEISSAVSKITNYTGIALSPSNKLYFDGTYHMLEQPEFRELEMARDFLRIIEERYELLKILSENLAEEGTIVRIGRENIFEELRECTIITATYKFKKQVSGSIGIIGPMRMKYERIVPLVEQLAEMTTEALEEM